MHSVEINVWPFRCRQMKLQKQTKQTKEKQNSMLELIWELSNWALFFLHRSKRILVSWYILVRWPCIQLLFFHWRHTKISSSSSSNNTTKQMHVITNCWYYVNRLVYKQKLHPSTECAPNQMKPECSSCDFGTDNGWCDAVCLFVSFSFSANWKVCNRGQIR